MSRGKKCADMDETYGLYTIGQAINYCALHDLRKSNTNINDESYLSASGGVSEGMSFALEKLYKLYISGKLDKLLKEDIK